MKRTQKLMSSLFILAALGTGTAMAEIAQDKKAPYSIEAAGQGVDGKSQKASLELKELAEERTAAAIFIKGKLFNPLSSDLKNVIVEASFVTEGNNALHRTGITIPLLKAQETLSWAITMSPAEKKEFLDIHQVPYFTYVGIAGIDGIHSGVEKWETIENSIQYRPVPPPEPVREEMTPETETVEYH